MSQVQALQVQPAAMELESQRQVEKSMKDLKTKVEVCVCEYTRIRVCLFVCLFKNMIHSFIWQVMEHSIRCLEEQQDEFDFKYQTHLMDCEAAHFILTLSLISLYMVVLMCVCI